MRRLVVLIALLAAPAAHATGPLPLTPCGDRLCGTLTVPVDRSQPSGPTTAVYVQLIPAERPAYRGRQALALLNGGPGGMATSLASLGMNLFYDVWQTHDILLVNQRGTGSDALFCPLTHLLPYDSPAATVTEFWTTCLATLGVDPNTYTTAVAMQDLDDVRAALGYDKLDLYGVSYGATAAQYYLLEFPQHVRSVVLDSGTPLDTPFFDNWGRNAQLTLDALFGRCAKDRACHKAFPSPAKDLRTLLARLATSPPQVNGLPMTPAAFAFAVQDLSQDAGTAAQLPFLLHRALTKGVPWIATQVDLRVYLPDVQLMSWAIECGEPWARFDLAQIAASDRGSYLAAADAQTFAFMQATCAAFPAYRDVLGAEGSVRSSIPALWLIGSGDPQTPVAEFAGVKAAMPNAKVVVVHGAGHHSLGVGCAATIANKFVLRGSMNGIDSSCAAKTPYPAWRVR